MLGINPNVQRDRMDEALGIILRLFREQEPITYVSDWFELHDAVLQVRPYQKPHMPIAVASVRSPAGPELAGKHGAAVLSMSVPRETEARADINYLWSVAETSAAEHGQTVRRDEWRLVLPVHLAETRDEAINDLRMGAGRFNREYLGETLGRPMEFDGPVEKILEHLMETGSGLSARLMTALRPSSAWTKGVVALAASWWGSPRTSPPETKCCAATSSWRAM